MRHRRRPPTLFTAGKAPSQAYRNLRAANSEETASARAFAEKLWGQYSPHADDHFLEQIRRDFHARFWEMYLTCALLKMASKRGYRLQCPKPGPDVLIEHNGHRIWVEAVTATRGDPSKPDSLVERIDGRMSIVPADKIVLRYSNAIATKHARYCEYRADRIIGGNDSSVIAVNGWPLDYSWASPSDMPRFLKALFPFGALGFPIDPVTKKLGDGRYQRRPIIHKSNRAPVSTEIFIKDEYRGLSAVLHSHAHAFMNQPLGADFEIAHNPLALQPLPPKLLPSCREWRGTANADGGYELAWQSQPSLD